MRRAINAEIERLDPRRKRRRHQAYVRRQKKKAADGNLTDFEVSCEWFGFSCIRDAYARHLDLDEDEDLEAPDDIVDKIYDEVVAKYREAWTSVSDPFDIDAGYEEAHDFAYGEAVILALNRIKELK